MGDEPAISRPGDRPGLPRSGSRPLPVRQADDFRTSMSGNRPETVRKPSAYRTTSGRFPDIAVWVSTRSPVPLVPLHTHPPTPPPAKRASLRQLRGEVQCPETVRKPSGRWTVCGRFPDIGFSHHPTMLCTIVRPILHTHTATDPDSKPSVHLPPPCRSKPCIRTGQRESRSDKGVCLLW